METDPFTKNKLDLYGILSLNRFIERIHNSIVDQMQDFESIQIISNIKFNSIVQQSNIEVIDSLHDIRDKSFVPCCFRVPDGTKKQNSDYFNLNNQWDLSLRGIYLTPQFLQTFDIGGFYDKTMLLLNIDFGCFMVGIKLFEQATGNAEAQDSYKTACQVFRMVCSKQFALNPCPFYIRYQRYDKDDQKSLFYLHDWNMTHDHKLNSTHDSVHNQIRNKYHEKVKNAKKEEYDEKVKTQQS